jgi:hypothetical protein
MSRIWRALRIIAALAAIIYACVYIDLTLRARSAFLEGEKYMGWHENPSEKQAFYSALFEERQQALQAERSAGSIGAAELTQRLELEAFRRDEAVAESSLKYAYHWYKSAVELFTPPESRWAKLAREKMPQVKALWKQELDSRKIPYEEYMLE